MMLGRTGGNRLNSLDISGIVVLGDNNGPIIQQLGSGPIPESPSVPWDDDLPPAPDQVLAMLNWRARLCPMIGRDADKASLLSWARTGTHAAIRVPSGEGGAGKIRLAAETAMALREEGWATGLVRAGHMEQLPIANKGLFLAIDYPEGHRADIRKLFEALARREKPPGGTAPIWLLLLSRQP
jgi:hypothetical protein